MSFIPEPPYAAPMIDALKRAERVWLKWFQLVQRAANIAPLVLGTVSLSGQNASIAATSVATNGALVGGLYRVSIYARVTTAAGVSSSLAPFVTYVENGIVKTQTGAALTANSTAVPGSWPFLVNIDPATVIKYGFTYASNAAGAMVYGSSIAVESVPPNA